MAALPAAVALFAAAQTAMWLDVPFVHQEKNGCGSAVVSMVMQYWKKNGAAVPPEAADARTIQRELYSSEASGIFASDLARYFERNGFRAFPFQAGWTDLKEHITKGRPLIVSIGQSPIHYVVVAGMDTSRNLLLVNDPATRKLTKMDRAGFERAWQDHWALLAVPQPAR